MRFRTYPKIGGPIRAVGGTWVATEKIHGANFVAAIAEDTMYFGKRKAWLRPDDPFFGWQLIAPELAAGVRDLARAVDAPQVVCYGELFGGGYPHPAIDAIAGLQPIQSGVWYAPDLRWTVFDVLVATGDDDVGELLAFRDVEALAAASALATPPVLGRGRRDELERIPVDAPTELPVAFGLPPIEGNRREGYVLKPDRPFAADERPVIKRKLADFDDARFDDAQAWEPGWLAGDELARWAARLVNSARIASARSKVGTEMQAIEDEIVLDVMLDLAVVFAETWRDLGAVREAEIEAVIRDAATRALCP